MSGTAVVHGLGRIREAMDPEAIKSVVRDALIAHARGEVVTPPPGQLLFDAPRGDCHIKFGHAPGGPTFVVKVATGFYDNPARGLPVNDGVVLLFSASTGQPLAIFQDEGWLTSWRTAAAGALAVEAGTPAAVRALGVVGTGHQAELQALWALRKLGDVPVLVWGRSAANAEALVQRLRAQDIRAAASPSLDALLQQCNVVVSATASNAPLFHASNIRPGTHLVSVGTDSSDKSECGPTLFAAAACVATDDHGQCMAFGDFGTAVRERTIAGDADVALGDVLAGTRSLRKREEDITLVTLTGVASQDLAIATLIHQRLVDQTIPSLNFRPA